MAIYTTNLSSKWVQRLRENWWRKLLFVCIALLVVTYSDIIGNALLTLAFDASSWVMRLMGWR